MALNSDGVDPRLPIVTNDIPHHRRQSEFTSDAENVRPARAMWWTEVANLFTDDIFKRRIAISQFLTNPRRRFEHQPGVGHGVVANQMSRGVNGADDVRALTGEAPDHEKRRADLMLGQDIEQLKGIRIVGAVIESEGDLIGVAVGDE